MIDVLGNALREAFGPTAAAFALAAIGLNIHYGYTGLLNFGHVGFMLLGAYGLGVTVATFGASFWLGILVAVLLAALFALLLGIPTLRLRSDYLAITTIAAAEILRLIVRSGAATDLTGGPFGLQSIANTFFDLSPFPLGQRYGIGLLEYSGGQLWVMVVTWTLVVLGALFTFLLTRSPWGRVLKSIREDEDAARSLGKNVYAFKLQSLVVGGVFGGLGGMMFAIAGQSANADSYQPVQTFFLYTIIILGGAATILGPVFGAMLFFFLRAGLDAFLREAQFLPDFLTSGASTGAVVLATMGALLMLLMAFRPQGLFGSRREMVLDV